MPLLPEFLYHQQLVEIPPSAIGKDMQAWSLPSFKVMISKSHVPQQPWLWRDPKEVIMRKGTGIDSPPSYLATSARQQSQWQLEPCSQKSSGRSWKPSPCLDWQLPWQLLWPRIPPRPRSPCVCYPAPSGTCSFPPPMPASTCRLLHTARSFRSENPNTHVAC